MVDERSLSGKPAGKLEILSEKSKPELVILLIKCKGLVHSRDISEEKY